MNHIKKLGLLIAICSVLSACFIKNAGIEWQVLHYVGDGVIHNQSIVFWPGYRIEFPKFSSAQPFQASYRLSHVPQVSGKSPAICLRFQQVDLVMARKLELSTSEISATLCDATGKIVYSYKVHIADAPYSETQGQFAIYVSGNDAVLFKRDASYVLKISYVPGDVPPPTDKLYVCVEVVGTN
jgi:hypothetical protein